MIGVSPLIQEVSKNRFRMRACNAKPPTQAKMSGILRVKRLFRSEPVKIKMHGSIQCAIPPRFSVNWYGGAMLIHGKTKSVVAMPRFEGLKK